MDSPLVSCICITENRPLKLAGAITCFQRQTYDNRELVIICKDSDDDTIRMLSQNRDKRIVIRSINSKLNLTLGERRNMGIDAAKGEYFCQWDDDDWYHSERISQQIAGVQDFKKHACVLSRVIIWDSVNREAYFSFPRAWENTILCKKTIFSDEGIIYRKLNKKEDTTFVSELIAANRLCVINSFPTYVYIYHGSNTWDGGHFKMLCSLSQNLKKGRNLIQDIVTGDLPAFEGCKRLKSEEFMSELNYFHHLQNSNK